MRLAGKKVCRAASYSFISGHEIGLNEEYIPPAYVSGFKLNSNIFLAKYGFLFEGILKRPSLKLSKFLGHIIMSQIMF